jgi:hypothetical protein
MKKIFFIISIFYLYGCSTSRFSSNEIESLDVKDIRANLQFLASDELEGREATTRGERLASLYLSAELEKYGVKPFVGDSSYLQPFDLKVTKVDTSSELIFTTDSGAIKLNYGEDFIIRGKIKNLKEDTALFVFAGFGISAPEFNYDNYDGIDVTGKYVLILDGEPQSDDSLFFDGQKKTKYSKYDYKMSIAKEKGALGCLFVADDRTQSYWPFIKKYSVMPKFNLPDSSYSQNGAPFLCLLNQEILSRLLDSNTDVYHETLAKISENGNVSSFGLSGEVNFSINQNEETRTSYNVVGVIPGNDSKLRNEYVAIGAHYDHEGIVDGKIFNGADDDASGTVTVLEVAKAFAREKNNNRSILVAFHTAEEKGLFGSEYLTDNITIMNDIVAQVNIDMVGREHIDTLYSVGSDKLSSELKQIVESVNNQTTNFVLNYQFDDPNDPERIFYRSDHYNYAKHGIPIAFFTDNMNEDYHKPTDDFEKIDFNKIKKTAKLVHGVVERLANLDHRLIVDKQK